MERKTVAVLTLGCRLNQADSALLENRLQKMGFEIVSPDASPSPNVIIVNSCDVTATACKKSMQLLRSVRVENPQSYLILTGCCADVEREALDKYDFFDLLLTNAQKREIERILPRHLALVQPPADLPPREPADSPVFHEHAQSMFPFKTRAILKVQEGCNNNCTYCIVPKARGKERSRAFQESIDDFKQLVDAGYKEIVLSGVNICNYECDGKRLPDLLNKFLEIPGDWRIRLSSTEPGDILLPLLDCMAGSDGRICNFLHLPLQSGCDKILEAMHRHYLTGDYLDFVEKARARFPQIHIGTDLIVGFPGETDAMFKESCAFLKKINFANIHVFPFSPRKGTPAADMPGKIAPSVMETRIEEMRELKAESFKNYAKSLIGTREKVLIELHRSASTWEGWSGNYVRTRVRTAEDISKQLVPVEFTGLAQDQISLLAKPV